MKLFNNAFIYLISNGVSALSPLLLLPFLTRFIDAADFGEVAYFAIVLAILNAVLGFSSSGIIAVRFFKDEKSVVATYVSACLAVLVATATFFSLVLVFLDKFSLYFSSIDIYLYATLASVFTFPFYIRLSLCQCESRVWKFFRYQFSYSFLMLVLSVFLVLYFEATSESRILAQVLAISLVGVVALFDLYYSGYLNLKFSLKEVATVTKFGLPIVPHAMAGLGIMASDRFLILKYSDFVQLGIYMAAFQLAQGVAILFESFNKAYAPWLMNYLTNSFSKKRLVFFSYMLMLTFLAVSYFYGMLVAQMSDYILGEEYIKSSDLVLFFSLGFGFVGCYYVVVNYIFYEEKTHMVMYATLSGSFVSVMMMIYMLNNFDFGYVSLAFLVANLTCFLVTWFLCSKVYSMPWFTFWRKV